MDLKTSIGLARIVTWPRGCPSNILWQAYWKYTNHTPIHTLPEIPKLYLFHKYYQIYKFKKKLHTISLHPTNLVLTVIVYSNFRIVYTALSFNPFMHIYFRLCLLFTQSNVLWNALKPCVPYVHIRETAHFKQLFMSVKYAYTYVQKLEPTIYKCQCYIAYVYCVSLFSALKLCIRSLSCIICNGSMSLGYSEVHFNFCKYIFNVRIFRPMSFFFAYVFFLI